jgi:hypothetical protein
MRRPLLEIDRLERGRKRPAMLINCKRVEREFVREAKARIQELHISFSKNRELAERKAERADGVPHSQELDVNDLRVFQHPAFLKREIFLSVLLLLRKFTDRCHATCLAVAGIKLRNGKRRAYADQTAFRDEARQTARGVSAAALLNIREDT